MKDYLSSEIDAHYNHLEQQEQAYQDCKDRVLEAIKNNERIVYGKGRQFYPADGDLYDRIAEVQAQIMQAYVNGNKELILALVSKCCEDEIESSIDLIGY